MDIKEELACIWDDIVFTAETAADHAAMQLTKLPRPLKGVSDEKLINLAAGHLIAGTLQSISLTTGKSLGFGLVNRQLNRAGKIVGGISLATSIVLALAAAHELYVRANPTLLSREEADAMIWRRIFGGNETSAHRETCDL